VIYPNTLEISSIILGSTFVSGDSVVVCDPLILNTLVLPQDSVLVTPEPVVGLLYISISTVE
jgi:hypothetical protein